MARLSTKKALASLKSFLCCNAGDDDRIKLDSVHPFIANSPQRGDRGTADVDVKAFVTRFLKDDVCQHGNTECACVPCYFDSHTNFDDYIIQRQSDVRHGQCEQVDTRNICDEFTCDDDSYCVCCDCNFNTLEHVRDDDNLLTSWRDQQSQAMFDSDNESVCSSCYHSNCTICRQALSDRYRIVPVDRSELGFDCSTPRFDAERLGKLLRHLDPGSSMTYDRHECGLLCYQVEDIESTHTSNTSGSRNDKDSGVGRTDDSLRLDDSAEQVLCYTCILGNCFINP